MILGLLCIAVLVNVTAALTSPGSDEGTLPQTDGGGGQDDGAGFPLSPHMGGDSAQYTHSSTAVQYSGNGTSWVRRTIVLEATMEVSITGTEVVQDGLGADHEAKMVREVLDGTYTLTVEGSDRLKDLAFSGGVHRDVVRHVDLHTGTLVTQAFRATLTVDDIPGIGRLVTTADAEVFPPAGTFTSLELTESLLDASGVTELTPGLEGDPLTGLGGAKETGNRAGERGEDAGAGSDGGATLAGGDWRVSEAEAVEGTATLLLNITVSGGEDMTFVRELWLSKGVSLPVRQRTSSITVSEAGGLTESVRLLGERTMVEDTYTRGGKALSPAQGPATLNARHPAGEYMEWDLMPAEGESFDASGSLVFSCDDAVEAALSGSPELSGFGGAGDGCMVTRASYNATQDRTDPDGRAGEYTWNLTFSRPGTVTPGEEATVVVKQDLKRSPITGGYSKNVTVDCRDGIIPSALAPGRDELGNELLTLVSSEELFRRHGAVDEALTDMVGRADLEGLTYGLYFGGQSPASDDELDLPLVQDSYLDLGLPDGACLWHLTKDEGSSKTVSACIDAQTGATLYVMTIESGRAALI